MALKHALLAATAVLGLLAAANAQAAQAQATGLTGMWLLAPRDFGAARPQPSLKPEIVAANEAARKAKAPGDTVLSEDAKRCLPEGMVNMMGNEFGLEFLETPGRVTIVSEDSPLVRSVYLKATHGEAFMPSWNGHSIGRYDGKTLVIDTVGFNDRKSYVGRGAPPSTTTHIIERYTAAADGKTMTGEMTIEDPAVLAQPFTVKRTYNRLEDDAELWEYACEVNAPGWSERFEGDPEAKLAPKS